MWGQDTVERCRHALGPNHLTTLWAAAGLTLALVGLGEVESARALGEDTLERCRQTLGPDHPIAQHLMQAAGSCHLLLGGDAAADRPSLPP